MKIIIHTNGIILLWQMVSAWDCFHHPQIFRNKTGQIQSSISNRGENVLCEWLIKGELQQHISVTFGSFETEYGCDYLYVHDGGSRSAEVIAVITGQQNGLQIKSSKNSMLLHFYSNCNVTKRDVRLTYATKSSNYSSLDNNTNSCVCGKNTCVSNTSCNQILKSLEFGTWEKMLNTSDVLGARSGHVSAYVNGMFLTHGGYNLNFILGDLLRLNFTLNEWELIEIYGAKPSPRFNHAAVSFGDLFVIFGGELNNSFLSNELWAFNTSSYQWKLLDSSNVHGVAGHTLTIAESNIYVIGGFTSNESLSTETLIYNILTSSWKSVCPSDGIQSNLRLVGHTSTYYRTEHVIIVFGGWRVSSKDSPGVMLSHIIVFDVNEEEWFTWQSDIFAPSLAYHTTILVADHLLIYGGVTTTNNKKYSPSQSTYFYRLNCHMWTNYKLQKNLPNKRLKHTSSMLDSNTMLVVGGYTGALVLNDIFVLKVPREISTNSSADIAGTHCYSISEREDCLLQPSCSYCNDNDACISFHSKNCPKSTLKPRNCKDSCQVRTSCESCVSPGHCQWCTLTSSCHYVNETSCSSHNLLWQQSNHGFVLNTSNECQLSDTPPGLTYVEYVTPKNIQYPDFVKVVPTGGVRVFNVSSDREVQLLGFVYPYFRFPDAMLTNHKVMLVGKSASIKLFVSSAKNLSMTEKLSLSFSADCQSVQSTEHRMFSFNESDRYNTRDLKYSVMLQGSIRSLPDDQSAYIELQWNHTDSPLFEMHPIPGSYLRNYFTVNCSQHITCTGCITDASCGWCTSMSSCLLRSNWTICANASSTSKQLARHHQECVTCDELFDCQSCKENSFCDWDVSTSVQFCKRAEFVGESSKGCSLACQSYQSVNDCVGSGNCVWCSQQHICMAHSRIILSNEYGQCRATYSQLNVLPQSCVSLTDCASCIVSYHCGWCYHSADPRVGKCLDGGFIITESDCNNTLLATGSSVLAETRWSYDQCPDIDECSLRIANCSVHAECINTPTSFNCVCRDGFEGNGTVCTKTCSSVCVNGICNKSTLICDCSLGWIGSNCSIDCGCYGHSTCLLQIGLCDKCHYNTRGEHCDICVNGTYGNASAPSGCSRCMCNGHGDETLNECSVSDGTCHCLHNTKGKNCDQCIEGYHGNPVSSGICYLPCERSTIISESLSGYLGAFASGRQPYTKCLWLLSARNLSNDNYIYLQPASVAGSIMLQFPETRLSCFHSQFIVYDGIPQNPRNNAMNSWNKFEKLARVCGEKSIVLKSQTGMMTVVYEGQATNYLNLVKFEVIRCPELCPPPFQCVNNHCVCPDGHFGLNCSKIKCPQQCNAFKGQGLCNKLTNLCECKSSFTGIDCGLTDFNSTFQIMGNAKGRFASSMVHYNNALYIFGGRDFNDMKPNDLLVFKLGTHNWKTISSRPSSRYFHCSVSYMGSMYIYGGVTSSKVTHEMWKFDMDRNIWTDLSDQITNVQLAGHTCTLVNDNLYIIGGYEPTRGFNNIVRRVQLDKMVDQYMRVSGLSPPSMYSHTAVYSKPTNEIFIHGGMSFHNEKLQVTSRTYIYDVNHSIWKHIESVPHTPAPILFGHTAVLFNNLVYIYGGYDDALGFNQLVFTWKPLCQQWSMLPHESDSPKTDFMFSSSVSTNAGVYMFGGFNNKVHGLLTLIQPQADVCYQHDDKATCLNHYDCAWCEGCHQIPACESKNVSATIGRTCNHSVIETQPCSAFTTCSSCLVHAHRCEWCGFPSRCGDISDNCHPRSRDIRWCEENICEAASCKNCGAGCMWTNYFRYSNEHTRIISIVPGFPYNCFRSTLLNNTSIAPLQRTTIRDAVSVCPRDCSLHTTCKGCLRSTVLGDFGGTTHCLWSSAFMECLSPALLPFKCLYGACGQLYSPIMIDKCPTICSSFSSCISCISQSNCGWCFDHKTESGQCLAGNLQHSFYEACSRSQDVRGKLQVVNIGLNVTWAYTICPLLNECKSEICKSHEMCVDLAKGYRCDCSVGYNKTGNVCTPVCAKCVHGTCTAPEKCFCDFGWTGDDCNTKCKCNGHSTCPGDTLSHVCSGCIHNTQGKACEQCIPFHVGDPRDGGVCQTCRSTCNNNANVCMSKSEYALFGNYSFDHLSRLLSRGPHAPSDTVCINCSNSEGDLCESCAEGFYKLPNNICVRCQCNGHASTCNKLTGTGCNCTGNTRTDPNCKTNCKHKQCGQCMDGYVGSPKHGRQCYKMLGADSFPGLIRLPAGELSFISGKNNYSNVKLRVIVDVYEGNVDVHFTDSKETFSVVGGSITVLLDRVRRSLAHQYVDTVSSRDTSSFVEFKGGVLSVTGVRKRLVITINSMKYKLKNKFFYIGVSAGTSTCTYHMVYREDLPRINLTLFFLILVVCLLVIICMFIVGCRARQAHLIQIASTQERCDLQTMANRPLAVYTFLCEISYPEKNFTLNILPVACQNTSDNMAGLLTVMVQYPSADMKTCALCLGSGITAANNQQLVCVKSSNIGSRGTTFTTRILETYA